MLAFGIQKVLRGTQLIREHIHRSIPSGQDRNEGSRTGAPRRRDRTRWATSTRPGDGFIKTKFLTLLEVVTVRLSVHGSYHATPSRPRALAPIGASPSRHKTIDLRVLAVDVAVVVVDFGGPDSEDLIVGRLRLPWSPHGRRRWVPTCTGPRRGLRPHLSHGAKVLSLRDEELWRYFRN